MTVSTSEAHFQRYIPDDKTLTGHRIGRQMADGRGMATDAGSREDLGASCPVRQHYFH